MPKFYVQLHDARNLHYDFRLEINGVLKSWVIPKGPSMKSSDKRLAIHVDDHLLKYGNFEGVISSGYGKGKVLLWDRGSFKNVTLSEEDKKVGLSSAYKNGKISVVLKGEKLQGEFNLIKFRGDDDWLLIKGKDEFVSKKDILKKSKSVKSGMLLREIKVEKPTKFRNR